MRIGSTRARSIVASVLILGVAVATNGQNVEQESSKANLSPLRLTLTPIESIVCSNRQLLLELQIENIGSEEIKIDKADFWSRFSYGYIAGESRPSIGRGGGMRTFCNDCRGKHISLLPGTAHWEKHEFKLEEFFQDVGEYSLRTRLPYKLGDKDLDVESNEIEFEVRECSIN